MCLSNQWTVDLFCILHVTALCTRWKGWNIALFYLNWTNLSRMYVCVCVANAGFQYICMNACLQLQNIFKYYYAILFMIFIHTYAYHHHHHHRALQIAWACIVPSGRIFDDVILRRETKKVTNILELNETLLQCAVGLVKI